MTIKEAEITIRTELSGLYPVSELEAMGRIVLQHLLGVTYTQLIQKATEELPANTEPQIYNIIHQLQQFRPLQYVLGETEFFGLRFLVNEDVLVPRCETEELVKWIIDDFGLTDGLRILDIGTGSGCIAVALAKNLINADVTALDISEGGLITAKQNAELNNTNIRFVQQDILKTGNQIMGNFDIIVSNPPYVSEMQKSEMLPNVLGYEPHLALFAPLNNPLAFYEAIAHFSLFNLKNNGVMYFEINEALPSETTNCFTNYGYKISLKKDINNKYRMLKVWGNGEK
jgi:release factor glutamine methyltransferase